MQRTMHKATLAAALLLAPLAAAAQATATPAPTPGGPRPTAVPSDFNDHEGFTELFDGKTLNGWAGDPAVWSVVDGAMVGQFHGEEGARHAQSYIILQGKEPADFELRMEIKMEGPTADSGIQYRSVHPPAGPPPTPRPGMPPPLVTDPKYNAIGLQYDFNQASGIGTIAESGGGGITARGIIAQEGQVIHAQTGKPMQILGNAGPISEVKAATWRMGEWNQVQLIARGHVLTQILNGRVTAVLFDDDAAKFRDRGIIGLQTSGAGSPKISFRNIWLREIK